jgi:AraC-like DNA-binding protein
MGTQSSENGCFEQGFDPIAEVLHDFRLSDSYYCRSELRAPWGLEIAGQCASGFHFVAEGSCFLRRESAEPLRLTAGDLVLLPRGGAYVLSDTPDGEAVPPQSLQKELIGQNGALLRHGGGGELTVLVGGGVRFADPGLNPLVDLMPDVLHIQSVCREQDAMLRAMVTAMGAEALCPRPGGATLMTRLADVLVVQAVRWWLDHSPEGRSGWLTALSDPQVGRALVLMHRRPEDPWTVGSLARAVHASRSTFSARFTELAGVPPMQYLTRRRMLVARRWLEEDRLALREIAARLGYSSEPSFSRAFKRYTGSSPGAARRGSVPRARSGGRTEVRYPPKG